MFRSNVIDNNAIHSGLDWHTLPLRAQSQSSGFSALYRQANAEVLDYIKHGTSSSGTTLSPEGFRARQQAVQAFIPTQPSLTHDSAPLSQQQQAFLATINPYTHEAAAKLGVAPHLVAAHAALESGWGRYPLTHADGSHSHNLFGIKAGGAWQGEVVAASTTEHENGENVRRTERFRAYPDFQQAFADYAQLITGNRRFSAALGAGSNVTAFAQALARGGYATDPNYANKLVGVAASMQR